MWVLLSVYLEYLLDLVIYVVRRFNLQGSHEIKYAEMNEGSTSSYRGCQIHYCLSCNMCFLMIVFDFEIDYMDRLVEVTATSQEIYSQKHVVNFDAMISS